MKSIGSRFRKDFSKKIHFYLVVSKKYCTFAPANEEKTFLSGVVMGGVFILVLHFGAIAQLVEHRTENPCVTGSNPVGTTLKDKELRILRSSLLCYKHLQNFLEAFVSLFC